MLIVVDWALLHDTIHFLALCPVSLGERCRHSIRAGRMSYLLPNKRRLIFAWFYLGGRNYVIEFWACPTLSLVSSLPHVAWRPF